MLDFIRHKTQAENCRSIRDGRGGDDNSSELLRKVVAFLDRAETEESK